MALPLPGARIRREPGQSRPTNAGEITTSALDGYSHRPGRSGDDQLAASMLVAFRSGILTCAMSLTCALVILPTLVLCGSALPLATPAAFLISSAAGGVFVMNEKVRSS